MIPAADITRLRRQPDILVPQPAPVPPGASSTPPPLPSHPWPAPAPPPPPHTHTPHTHTTTTHPTPPPPPTHPPHTHLALPIYFYRGKRHLQVFHSRLVRQAKHRVGAVGAHCVDSTRREARVWNGGRALVLVGSRVGPCNSGDSEARGAAFCPDDPPECRGGPSPSP